MNKVYLDAKRDLESQVLLVKSIRRSNPKYFLEFQKLIEMTITVKGDGLSMDVAAERRGMAKLVTTVISQLRHSPFDK